MGEQQKMGLKVEFIPIRSFNIQDQTEIQFALNNHHEKKTTIFSLSLSLLDWGGKQWHLVNKAPISVRKRPARLSGKSASEQQITVTQPEMLLLRRCDDQILHFLPCRFPGASFSRFKSDVVKGKKYKHDR